MAKLIQGNVIVLADNELALLYQCMDVAYRDYAAKAGSIVNDGGQHKKMAASVLKLANAIKEGGR